MTTEEFNKLFIGFVGTTEGVIVNLFSDGRMRVTDYLPGGINQWFKVSDPNTLITKAVELCELNGWHPNYYPHQAI